MFRIGFGLHFVNPFVKAFPAMPFGSVSHESCGDVGHHQHENAERAPDQGFVAVDSVGTAGGAGFPPGFLRGKQLACCKNIFFTHHDTHGLQGKHHVPVGCGEVIFGCDGEDALTVQVAARDHGRWQVEVPCGYDQISHVRYRSDGAGRGVDR